MAARTDRRVALRSPDFDREDRTLEYERPALGCYVARADAIGRSAQLRGRGSPRFVASYDDSRITAPADSRVAAADQPRLLDRAAKRVSLQQSPAGSRQ